jgi:hypothetical protein
LNHHHVLWRALRRFLHGWVVVVADTRRAQQVLQKASTYCPKYRWACMVKLHGQTAWSNCMVKLQKASTYCPKHRWACMAALLGPCGRDP